MVDTHVVDVLVPDVGRIQVMPGRIFQVALTAVVNVGRASHVGAVVGHQGGAVIGRAVEVECPVHAVGDALCDHIPARQVGVGIQRFVAVQTPDKVGLGREDRTPGVTVGISLGVGVDVRRQPELASVIVLLNVPGTHQHIDVAGGSLVNHP